MDRRRDSLGVIPAPEGKAEPPDWFVTAMHEGIIALCRLPLRYRPRPSPDIQYDDQLKMAEAFAEAAWKGRRWEERDRSRIQAGFALLAEGHRKFKAEDAADFPGAHDLLDAIPPRVDESPDYKHELTPEEQERAEQARQRLLGMMQPDPDRHKSRTEQIERINRILQREHAPIFRSEHEVRAHQRRQEVAGELIANLKLR